MKALHRGPRGRVGLMTALFAASVLVACATENGVVGGDCAEGFTRCGNVCVDLTKDPGHCGACGNACTGGASCSASTCSAPGAGPSASSDASPPSSDGGGPSVVGPWPSGDISANVDASTDAGATVCAAPNVECGSAGCVDVRTSTDHCGACNAFCASGRCIDGVCEGALAGHAVLIGHDYAAPLASDSYLSSQERLLANAAMLAPSSTVRVVAVETFAHAKAATNVRLILMRAAAEKGRSLQLGTTDDLGSVKRSSADVVLVLDQVAADGRFASKATAARDPLARFLEASGVVIVLDGASAGSEMVSFTRDAGLFDVAGHVPASGPFFVDARDVVAFGVPSPYAAREHTTAFGFGELGSGGAWVTVADANGAPVVLHGAR